MKKLLLIRHAKATHDAGYSDFERPLKPSGLEDAETMALRLKEHAILPQIIISSPALRTFSTANVFAEHLSLPQPLTDKRIYDAHVGTLFDVVNELPDEHDFIALVGHNPGFSELLYHLTHDTKEMETCAVALVALNVNEWAGVGNGSGAVAYYRAP